MDEKDLYELLTDVGDLDVLLPHFTEYYYNQIEESE